MLPDLKLTEIGKLKLSIYTFKEVGDELPMHEHEEGVSHITIVNAGSIKAYGKNWEKILTPGKITMFSPNQPHAFVALEDNSKVTNIVY